MVSDETRNLGLFGVDLVGGGILFRDLGYRLIESNCQKKIIIIT
jgi:hypothetical protein